MFTIKLCGWHWLDDKGDMRFVGAAHSVDCSEAKYGKTVTVDGLDDVKDRLTDFVNYYAGESRAEHETCDCLRRLS